MPLAKKGSRKIHVDGEDYRWVVSQPDMEHLCLVVEHLESPGQRISVLFASRDYWLDCKDIESGRIQYSADDYRPITSSLVRQVILDALQQGWTPRLKSKPLLLKLSTDDSLEPRNE